MAKCKPGCTCRRHTAQGIGPANSNWRGDAAGIDALHDRVEANFGKAREWDCEDCGEPADDWSRIHGTDGKSLDDYKPRCRKCHIVYDTPGSVPEWQTEGTF